MLALYASKMEDSMGQDILVGVLFVIAVAACVWAWWGENKG